MGFTPVPLNSSTKHWLPATDSRSLHCRLSFPYWTPEKLALAGSQRDSTKRKPVRGPSQRCANPQHINTNKPPPFHVLPLCPSAKAIQQHTPLQKRFCIASTTRRRLPSALRPSVDAPGIPQVEDSTEPPPHQRQVSMKSPHANTHSCTPQQWPRAAAWPSPLDTVPHNGTRIYRRTRRPTSLPLHKSPPSHDRTHQPVLWHIISTLCHTVPKTISCQVNMHKRSHNFGSCLRHPTRGTTADSLPQPSAFTIHDGGPPVHRVKTPASSLPLS